MENNNLKFEFAEKTDVGCVRKGNEDAMGNFKVPNGHLFVLCDGMGGHLGGATAAKIGVTQIHQYFQQYQTNIVTAIRNAIIQANNSIIKKANENATNLYNMGATCVVVLVATDKIWYGYAGDSRLYQWVGQEAVLKLITKDHSYVQQLMDNQLLTSEEARTHPRRNEITSALGFNDIIIEVYPHPLIPQKGDIFLLCSDGLNNMVEDKKIEAILKQENASLASKAKKLIDTANEQGGVDNVTAQLIEFE